MVNTLKLGIALILLGVANAAFAPARFAERSTRAIVQFGIQKDASDQDLPPIHNQEETVSGQEEDSSRRQLFLSSSTAALGMTATGVPAAPAWAGNSKSRTDGYAVQKSEDEWQSQLSDMQYYILRRGGTESPNYSILEGEDRPGVFACAGCGTDLFVSQEKFHSGTGWPSFARAIDAGVEVEAVNAVTANLVGAELRCKTCGGHLGDVFNDGFLFVGTPAFVSGKRYCIDGAALIFKPAQEGAADVRGDTMKPQSLPSWFDPPKITPQ